MKKAIVYQIKWSDYQQNPSKINELLDQANPGLKEPVAIKTHFGEPGNENALRGEIVQPAIDWSTQQEKESFLTDTNTLYTGQRSETDNHLETARKHGFADLGVPVVISEADEHEYTLEELDNQYSSLPIKLGKKIREAGSIFCLSHVKGHILFGFGGALKNLGMGGASPAGKKILHASTIGEVNEEKCILCAACVENCPTEAISLKEDKIEIDYDKCIGCGECLTVCPKQAIEMKNKDVAVCQEKTAVYAYALTKDKPCLYVNYIINVNKVCDCASSTKPKLIEDLGIIVSADPVAADQASLDWINREAGKDLFAAVNEVDYEPILAISEAIGLGTRDYELEKI